MPLGPFRAGREGLRAGFVVKTGMARLGNNLGHQEVPTDQAPVQNRRTPELIWHNKQIWLQPQAAFAIIAGPGMVGAAPGRSSRNSEGSSSSMLPDRRN